MGTHGIGTFLVDSKFASGNLVFYEKTVGRTTTGDLFTIGTATITIGNTAQDVDLKVYLGSSTEYVFFDVGNSRVDFGEDDQGVDIRIFGDTSGAIVLWDTSDNRLEFDGADINLQDSDILQFGDGQDVAITWNATNLVVTPATDDTGAIHLGNGTLDMDVKWFGGTTAKYVQFDVGDVYLYLEDVDLKLGDNDEIKFGDASGGDVTLKWDATQLEFLPTADDTGAINIGDGTTDIDFKWFGGTTAKYVQFDVGNVYLTLEDVDLRLGDNDEIKWGDASGGDVTVKWDGSLLQFLPTVDDTGYIAIGNGVTSMDFWVYTGVGNYLQVDVGNDYLSLINLSLYAPNLATSAGQAGIVYVNANGYLIQSD